MSSFLDPFQDAFNKDCDRIQAKGGSRLGKAVKTAFAVVACLYQPLVADKKNPSQKPPKPPSV